MDLEKAKAFGLGAANNLLFGIPEIISSKAPTDIFKDYKQKYGNEYTTGDTMATIGGAIIPGAGILKAGKALKAAKAAKAVDTVGDLTRSEKIAKMLGAMTDEIKATKPTKAFEVSKIIDEPADDFLKIAKENYSPKLYKEGAAGEMETVSDVRNLYNDVDDSRLLSSLDLHPISNDKIIQNGPIGNDIILHGSDSTAGKLTLKNKSDRAFSATEDWNVANRYGTGDIYASRINNPKRILDLSNKDDRLKIAQIIYDNGDNVQKETVKELADSLKNMNLESDFQIAEAYSRDNRLLTALRYSGYAGVKDSMAKPNYEIWDTSVLSSAGGKQ